MRCRLRRAWRPGMPLTYCPSRPLSSAPMRTHCIRHRPPHCRCCSRPRRNRRCGKASCVAPNPAPRCWHCPRQRAWRARHGNSCTPGGCRPGSGTFRLTKMARRSRAGRSSTSVRADATAIPMPRALPTWWRRFFQAGTSERPVVWSVTASRPSPRSRPRCSKRWRRQAARWRVPDHPNGSAVPCASRARTPKTRFAMPRRGQGRGSRPVTPA
jgi:hypothetical protein